MIYVGLGANLPGPAGAPARTLDAALAALAEAGLRVVARSQFYASAAVPPSAQPDFVNAVAALDPIGAPPPAALLDLLLTIERRFGRVRSAANAPRTLDLDLLDYPGMVRPGPEPPILPHPRLVERAFVLLPLAEIAPDWRHPASGAGIADLIAALPTTATASPLEEGRGTP